ncbi:MAG: thiamine pyrophosphate-dependent dehydrogenase E1 component subunit alpha [Lentisphaeria bacterium]|nr:thiamine pyrophosphate-dependent dehydrogenase E1 component subunit alpha [Lentisphaeria bacterium]
MAKISKKDLLDRYSWMLTIRHFERRAKELYRASLVKGALHLYIGEEAIAVGVCSALRDDDCIFSTHRSHGHYLAKTHDVDGAMAELLGRATGCSRGHGGSMHMFNRNKGFLGSNGIVGGGIPLAMGAAFAAKYRHTDAIGATFFGDGAANQGVLHETLNMCALLKLPLLAICENNGVAATTLTTRSTAEQDRCKLAAAYGIAAETVDGNDLEAVCDAAARAVKAIRKTGSPRLLDLRSYRMEPHCGIIKDNRDPEIHHRQVTEFDPLLITARRHPDIFTEKELAKLQSLAESRVESAITKALAAPMPDPELFKQNFGVC